MHRRGSSNRHFDQFGARAVLALVVAALVIFAHSAYHLQILGALGLAALLVWIALEIRHTFGQRHLGTESRRR